MSLPYFLLAELRIAFRTSCKPQRSTSYTRQFSITRATCKKEITPEQQQRKAAQAQRQAERRTVRSSKNASNGITTAYSSGNEASNSDTSSTELTVADPSERAVSSGRKFDVPLRVVPKEQVTPNVRLTPRERLHIEMLTRRQPQTTEKRTYKERLIIYHMGNFREKALIFLKMSAIAGSCITTFLITPAYWMAGHSYWLVAGIFLTGLLPPAIIHAFSKSFVTRVFLHLPPHARVSPQAAMDYARNLPRSAMLTLEFARAVPLPGRVDAILADLKPASSRWRPVTFKWSGIRADPGSFFMGNPLSFWVKPVSSEGKASRYTIPGIWPNVYKRLAGVESKSVSKWRR